MMAGWLVLKVRLEVCLRWRIVYPLSGRSQALGVRVQMYVLPMGCDLTEEFPRKV